MRTESSGRNAIATGERVAWIDVARGVAIIGVVLFHAGAVAPDGTVARQLWNRFDLAVFTFILPLFFLLSGLLFERALNEEWRPVLRRRVFPLLYLFVLWSCVFAVVSAMTKGTVGWDLTQNLTLQTVLWFLPGLALDMLVFRALRRVPPGLHIVLAASIAFPFAVWFPFDGYGLTHTPHFYVFFALGGLWSSSIKFSVLRSTSPALLIAISASIGLLAAAALLPGGRAVLYALSPLATVPAVVLVSARIAGSRLPRAVLGYIGRRTLPVFLVHALVLQLAAWVVLRGDTTSVWWTLSAPASASLVGILVGLVLARVCGGVRGIFSAPWLGEPGAAQFTGRRIAPDRRP